MRIFFLCQRVPFPPNRGDKITTFNEIRHLSKQHDVHVFCLADGKDDLENVPGLLPYAKSVTAIPYHPMVGKLRALIALFTGAPLSVAAFTDKKLQAAINQESSARRPDLLFVFSCNMAQFAAQYPDIPRVVQFGDLDSLKWDQYANRARGPMKWIYRAENRRILRYERQVASSFSHSLVCTPRERDDFERWIPGQPVSVVGNGVDIDYFQPQGRAKTPASMIFTGVMDYLPNADAVQWFCEEILPLVRTAVPHASFVICGSRPSKAVQDLAKIPGVTVTGFVPDVRTFLDAAEVFVAPLRIARGIQNKLLEAMAMELPCVSTAAVWAATEIPQGQGGFAADDPSDLAKQVIRLLTDPAMRSEVGKRGRTAVVERYAWATQFQALDRVVAPFERGCVRTSE